VAPGLQPSGLAAADDPAAVPGRGPAPGAVWPPRADGDKGLLTEGTPPPAPHRSASYRVGMSNGSYGEGERVLGPPQGGSWAGMATAGMEEALLL